MFDGSPPSIGFSLGLADVGTGGGVSPRLSIIDTILATYALGRILEGSSPPVLLVLELESSLELSPLTGLLLLLLLLLAPGWDATGGFGFLGKIAGKFFEFWLKFFSLLL